MLKEQQGCVRKVPVKIGGSNYIPLSDPLQLEEEMNYLMQQYLKIENPFEQSLYIHNNLAYLQYFIDHNKRTSRNMLAFSLLTKGKMPILFNERTSNEYANAVISYYETGKYDLSKKYFLNCYKELVKNYGKKIFQKDIKVNRKSKNVL